MQLFDARDAATGEWLERPDVDFTYRRPAVGRDALPQVELSGAIDHVMLPRFEAHIAELRASKARRHVLDVSKLIYVNGDAQRLLAAFGEELRAAGGGVALVGVAPKLRVVLEQLGFTERLAICPDAEAAVAALRPTRRG